MLLLPSYQWIVPYLIPLCVSLHFFVKSWVVVSKLLFQSFWLCLNDLFLFLLLFIYHFPRLLWNPLFFYPTSLPKNAFPCFCASSTIWLNTPMSNSYWLPKTLNLFRSSSWKVSTGSLSLSTSSFSLVITRLWSLPTSASLEALTSWRYSLHRLLIMIWSVWLFVWTSGEFQVHLWNSLCWNRVPQSPNCSRHTAQSTVLHCCFWYLIHVSP